MNALELVGLGKQFGSTAAVAGLTFSVARGELFGLIGPDGAGKTTTLRMLATIMDPTVGTARVLGRDIITEAEAIKEEIGYMSQRFGLYPDLTVLENLHFYADIYGVPKKERAAKTESLLAFSNLTSFKSRHAGNLSGGMKQKLGLACALIHAPRVLFLDEPTNGVDPVSRRDFWRILYQLLREGATIFVTTAYLDEADRCHRVGLMHQGRLLACDSPRSLRRLVAGTIFEIRTVDPRKAARILRENIPEASVGLFGDRVHLVTANTREGEVRATSLLATAGVELTGMRQIEPSLEDVFVSVLQQETASAARTE
jgi:ABC-2 type transport system ATP-binding protein